MKQKLLSGLDAELQSDTFYLNKWDSGKHLHASPDDMVILDLPEHSVGGYQWVFESGAGNIQILEDENQEPDSGSGEIRFGSTSQRRMTFRAEDHIKLKEEQLGIPRAD